MRWTWFFKTLEFMVILLPWMIFIDVSRGTGFFGAWTSGILMFLLFLLLAVSLVLLPRRTSLAIEGLFVFVMVIAACVFVPVLFPSPTKGHRTESRDRVAVSSPEVGARGR